MSIPATSALKNVLRKFRKLTTYWVIRRRGLFTTSTVSIRRTLRSEGGRTVAFPKGPGAVGLIFLDLILAGRARAALGTYFRNSLLAQHAHAPAPRRDKISSII